MRELRPTVPVFILVGAAAAAAVAEDHAHPGSAPAGRANMPYPDLAPADLANVVAYIMSLRRGREDREAH